MILVNVTRFAESVLAKIYMYNYNYYKHKHLANF